MIAHFPIEKVIMEMFKRGGPHTLSLIWQEDLPPLNENDALSLYRSGEYRRQHFLDDQTHDKPASSGHDKTKGRAGAN